MQFSADTKLYGSTPMFRKRPSTSTTLLAWTVVNTRWPVSAELMAICAVSVVADFADHDLVRIVAQDRAQAAREGQALFLVDRNLRDAAHLVFDRIFDGDDLVFVVLDLVERGVERGRLAATRSARSPAPCRTAP